MHVVIIGNIIDGITIYGPFQDYQSALNWVGNFHTKENWHIAKMEPINEN